MELWQLVVLNFVVTVLSLIISKTCEFKSKHIHSNYDTDGRDVCTVIINVSLTVFSMGIILLGGQPDKEYSLNAIIASFKIVYGIGVAISIAILVSSGFELILSNIRKSGRASSDIFSIIYICALVIVFASTIAAITVMASLLGGLNN